MYMYKTAHLFQLPTQTILKNVKRCRDGNVCEAYVIPFLFGLFFAVCHPYIIVHFCRNVFFVTCIIIDSTCNLQTKGLELV